MDGIMTSQPNNLEAFWMPFTMNRQFKKAPRMLVTALEVIETTWRDTVQGVIIIAAVALAGRAWHTGGRSGRRRPDPSSPPPTPEPAPAQPSSP